MLGFEFSRVQTSVEGLNVINDPKCNKVLNVTSFSPKCNKLLRVANYSNYSNKRRPQISAPHGGLITAAALIRAHTVLRGVTMVLSAALK